ncbi:MAG: TlpA disulfide reductase family protein [Balneola sp.]|jgi:thiol-disulfide isomerase/thioredoxin
MENKTSSKRRRSFKQELIEWGAILSVIGILYFSGLHVPVIGNLQRVLLWTGLMTPDTELPENQYRAANYNLPLLSLDGDELMLEEFEGKTIFLNFWATWCPPCIAEMPNIQALYKSVESDSFQFVMVSLDEDHQKARNYLERKEYTFPVYFLNGRKPGTYNSTVVPTTYVISPDGKIVTERRGMANYNTSGFKEFLRSF